MSKAPYSLFMDIYAAFVAYMRSSHHAATNCRRVGQNHSHSVHNPLAQYRNAYTIGEVLAAPPSPT